MTNRPPLVVVSPDIEPAGKEFADQSISLSANYVNALTAVGALPLVLPATVAAGLLAECVRRADGVLLTGGDDVDPRLYARRMPRRLRETVKPTADGGARDLREMLLIDEALRQRKPLLAICRGQQILNVALGGTLIADIPSQVPEALAHRRMDRRSDIVHEVRLTGDSVLARITGKQNLGVNSTHHQAVGRVAPPLRVAAESTDGIVEALELKPGIGTGLSFFLSVQFHPERLADRYPEHKNIFRAFVDACAAGRERSV